MATPYPSGGGDGSIVHMPRATANTHLAEILQSANLSHAALARRVNELGRKRGLRLAYDKTSVSHWLSGTLPRPAVRHLLAEVLSERLHRPVLLAELGLPAPELPDCVASGLAFHQQISDSIDTLAALAGTDVERRSLMKSAPFIVGALVTPQRDWMLAVLREADEYTTGGEQTRQSQVLRHMNRVFEELDNRFGGGYARVAVLRYLADDVGPLLRRPYPHAERRQVFAAAAKLAATAGWMSYDSGAVGPAQRYMTQALRLAAEGRDRVLGGQILAGLSHLATEAGSPREAVRLAEVGLATTTGTDSLLGQMRLHAMRARAYAALGDRRSACSAILSAENAFDSSGDRADQSEWVRFLDHAYLAGESAASMLRVGDYGQAEVLARQAVSGAGELGRRRTINLVRLATAQLKRSDVEAAVATAAQAVDACGGVSSKRSLSALEGFRKRLQPFRQHSAVREFESLSVTVLGWGSAHQ